MTPRARTPGLLALATACALTVPGGPADVGAQTTPAAPTSLAGEASRDGWNTPEVLELIGRARALRGSTAVDPELRSYSSQARGYVYFFVDRPDSAENVLVKIDQVALDLYFLAPNTTRQRIVGRRDEEVLPTSIRYHLDHLTVVQDDFGDFIRLGDGDEVAAVVHPISERAEDVYDFQLADSLRISYAGGAEEIRVYEVRVRPRDLERPGYVGTIFLDRDRAAIVRMNFSFTPSSYVDPYLDYIRISTDNSLWMGEWWLPYRQEIEIRRETPLLDFLAGSTIRVAFDVRRYEFNEEIPAPILAGAPVTTAPPSQRERFPFERGLYDDLEEQGDLTISPALEAVEAEVREVVEESVMSGLSPFRFHLSRISDFARYNRAEGIYLGAGASWRPRGDLQLRGLGGYSFGRAEPAGAMAVRLDRPGLAPALDLHWNAVADIGGHPGATPLENTITSASGEEDFLDPYVRRGAALSLGRGAGARPRLTARWEEHVGARDVVSDGDSGFRPIRSVAEGTLTSLSLTTRFGIPGDGSAVVAATGARLLDRNFASASTELEWTSAPSRRVSTRALLSGGVTTRDAPPQALFLLGGRHTMLGHPYRLFEGHAYWMGRVETTVPVWAPWLGIRAFAVLGATTLWDDAVLPDGWGGRDSRGVRGSVGLGLSIGWDSAHFDVGRAIRGTGWEAVFSVAPRFRSWL